MAVALDGSMEADVLSADQAVHGSKRGRVKELINARILKLGV
jgi:hypothetical protein